MVFITCLSIAVSAALPLLFLPDFRNRSMATFVKALYSFSGEGQAVPLPLAESTVVLQVESTPDGWCRGFSGGREGWFPAAYVKAIEEDTVTKSGTPPGTLAAVLRSPQWIACATSEDKIYFVNTATQATTWEVPNVRPLSSASSVSVLSPTTPTSVTSPTSPSSLAVAEPNIKRSERPLVKSKRIRQKMVNGLTFPDDPSDQELLNPGEQSYVDYFWADKGEQSGFDILLEKHLNGKNAIKEMAEFYRERAALEEHYAKGLLKLSKSTLGDQEEGTIGKAWQVLKAELFHRSKAHSDFAAQLLKEIEKPMMDFKEGQKKERKEHQQIIERSRKQVQALDASIEKAKIVMSGKTRKHSSRDDTGISLLRRSTSTTTGDELKKMEDSYNQAQRHWVDNMINACRDYQRHEEERSDFLQGHFLKYIETCVGVDEASAESLSRVTDAVDRVNKKADRNYFIKTKGTGTVRPEDRV